MYAIAKRSLSCCAGKNIRRRHFQVTERSSLVLKSYALPTKLKSMFSGKGLSILLSIGAFYTNCPIKQIEFSQENLNSKTGKQETHFSFIHLSGASFILLVRVLSYIHFVMKMKGKLEIYVLYKTYDLLYLLIYFPIITNKNFSFLKLAFIILY